MLKNDSNGVSFSKFDMLNHRGTMEEPSHKRQRVDPEKNLRVPYFYYDLMDTVIPIFGVDPERDLHMFKDAFVCDLADPETVGMTEENPFHVTPSIARIMLGSPNPMMALSVVARSLEKVTVECRDPEMLEIIYDFAASKNLKASIYWRNYYDAIVDSICRDESPDPTILPVPETIVDIAILIGRETNNSLDVMDPDNKYDTGTYQLCVRDLMEEAITATGSNLKWINRVLSLNNLIAFDGNQHYYESERFLKVYWKWKSVTTMPSQDSFLLFSLTDNTSFRYALLYEKTRNMFSSLYSSESQYVIMGNYSPDIHQRPYRMIEPMTGDFVDISKCKEVWTPEYIQFLKKVAKYKKCPSAANSFVLRMLPSARTSEFTSMPFNIHPFIIHLLNRNPIDDGGEIHDLSFHAIESVPRDELHWENLDGLHGEIYEPCHLHHVVWAEQSIPLNLRDPTRNEICFDPRIRRLFKTTTSSRPVTASMHITLCFPGNPYPAGKNFDAGLRTKTASHRYTVNRYNRHLWKLLQNFHCEHLCNRKIQRVLNHL